VRLGRRILRTHKRTCERLSATVCSATAHALNLDPAFSNRLSGFIVQSRRQGVLFAGSPMVQVVKPSLSNSSRRCPYSTPLFSNLRPDASRCSVLGARMHSLCYTADSVTAGAPSPVLGSRHPISGTCSGRKGNSPRKGDSCAILMYIVELCEVSE
jgi:hypothetical protein